MRFQVEWQVLVYDDFDKLKAVNNETPFEIEVDCFEKGREIAEKKANLLVLRQISHQHNGFCTARVIALIDENGVRHQFQER